MAHFQQRALPDTHIAATPSPLCELCGNKPHLYCPADQAFLCRSCDDRVHSANFIVVRHTRSALCQCCLGDTGLRVHGVRERMHCEASPSGAESDPASPMAQWARDHLQLCSNCSLVLDPLSIKQLKRKRGFSLAAATMPTACDVANLRTADLAGGPAYVHLKQSLKRRRASMGNWEATNAASCMDDICLGLAVTPRLQELPAGRISRVAPPGLPPVGNAKSGLGHQWLRLATEEGDWQELQAECGPQDSSTSSPTVCVSSVDRGTATEEVEGPKEDAFASRMYPKMYSTPAKSFVAGSVASSIGSCSEGNFGRAEAGRDCSDRLLETMGSGCQENAHIHMATMPETREMFKEAIVKSSEGAPGATKTVGSQASSGRDEGEAAGASPLGHPASSRLRRVLRSWSESLGGVNAGTQNLAYELFQRTLMRMKRGQVAASFLRVTLAACLWLAMKLVELRAHVPGVKEVASITAVPGSDLRNAEITVLKLLDWQPLKHVGDKVAAEAGIKET